MRSAFRERLLRVERRSRDAWVDGVLGLGDIRDDGHDLPRGCVPYLPSPVEAVLAVVERAAITSEDVFVDVGSGVGRAMIIVHLLTGAAVVGVEVQAELAAHARRRAAALGLDGVHTIHGDGPEVVGRLGAATVFFFYSPFGLERMARTLDAIRPLARVRPLRLCFVDTPPPDVPWMTAPAVGRVDSIVICRTHLHSQLEADAGARDAAMPARMPV